MRNVVLAALVAALVQAGAWWLAHDRAAPPDVSGEYDSLSYSPFGPSQDPLAGDRPDSAQIDRDMKLLAGHTRTIRTYSATAGVEMVPPIARRHGLNVSMGAWIDKDETRNKAELASLVDLAKHNRNIKSVIVGNEVLLRQDKTANEMIAYIRHVKKRTKLPVSTGEVWQMWLAHPELVKEVDFIAVHILPYWEGMPNHHVVTYTLERYDELRRTYPGKKIVIAEFGWPSQGYNNKHAVAEPLAQAQIMREFLAVTKKRGIAYNVVEAFDQPWKTMEGSVGAYWGMFTAERAPKFAFSGPIDETRDLPVATAGVMVGFIAMLIGLWRRRPTFAHAMAYGAAANVFGAGIAAASAYPFHNYMHVGAWVMWGSGFTLMLPLVVMTLEKVNELADVFYGRRPIRLLDPSKTPTLSGPAPMVSIHIPAYREQPEMLKATLDSVAALDYPNFEALVIINNTTEDYYWKPIEEHCAKLGPRFKFVFLPKVAGFKAGALNLAMTDMDPTTEVIAVIDADYMVHRDWLKDLVPHFAADSKVALIQAPQDHRDGDRSLLKSYMNSEYAGFFDVGMIRRNEDNAIIAHGTMLMVRRSAFEQVGGWSTDTIVEDTELGLRLYEAGYTGHYTNKRYGWGVLPDTFKAFKTQRERWAYGAIQIIKKHWAHMLPGSRTLSSAQKFHFVTGWMLWLSDALGALFSILNLIWVPAILLVGVIIPTVPLVLPIILAFLVNVLHSVLLYRARVAIPGKTVWGAAVAAMSLQLTVARAVFTGFVKDNLPFKRTDKGGNAKKSDDPNAWETRLGLALLASSLAVAGFNPTDIVEQYVFAFALFLQSTPFLAAMVMGWVEASETKRQARKAGAAAPAMAGNQAVAA